MQKRQNFIPAKAMEIEIDELQAFVEKKKTKPEPGVVKKS